MAIALKTLGRLGTLTIPSGTKLSDVLDLTTLNTTRGYYISIQAPSGLTGTVNMGVSNTGGSAGPFPLYRMYGVGTATDVILTANKTTQPLPISGKYLQIISGSNEANARNFTYSVFSYDGSRP